MPGTFQQESLNPIDAQGTFPYPVEQGRNGEMLYPVVHPWGKKEEYHTSRYADKHPVQGDEQVMSVYLQIAPIYDLDRNHVNRQAS